MDRPATDLLRIGEWSVNPASGEIARNGETARLEARAMRLLVCLAERAGQVVSIDDLLSQVWPGVNVSQDSVYQAVTSLRRVLGDDPRQPSYIATVPRLGYRMVANVEPWTAEPAALVPPAESVPVSDAPEPAKSPAPGLARRSRLFWAAAAAFCLALAGSFFLQDNAAGDKNSPAAVPAQPERSIAVLPFLDLTEGMKEEEFADGMTEELIDKLGKIPGLRVPPPTSSFFYKGKQIPVAEIAHALGVTYILDGSVRKSGGRVRIAARLVRADNGYIAWTETYDRPFGDILMVQDDIAGEVTRALKASIDGKSSNALANPSKP
jgi:TolB-like protein/DNA-binding winged helix-turn-helix (wHTH) protein